MPLPCQVSVGHGRRLPWRASPCGIGIRLLNEGLELGLLQAVSGSSQLPPWWAWSCQSQKVGKLGLPRVTAVPLRKAGPSMVALDSICFLSLRRHTWWPCRGGPTSLGFGVYGLGL